MRRLLLKASMPAGKSLGSESMEAAELAALEISTLDIILKALRATTGPDAHIMDEYGMNVQAGT